MQDMYIVRMVISFGIWTFISTFISVDCTYIQNCGVIYASWQLVLSWGFQEFYALSSCMGFRGVTNILCVMEFSFQCPGKKDFPELGDKAEIKQTSVSFTNRNGNNKFLVRSGIHCLSSSRADTYIPSQVSNWLCSKTVEYLQNGKAKLINGALDTDVHGRQNKLISIPGRMGEICYQCSGQREASTCYQDWSTVQILVFVYLLLTCGIKMSVFITISIINVFLDVQLFTYLSHHCRLTMATKRIISQKKTKTQHKRK